MKTLLDELEEIDKAMTEGDATPEQEKRGQELVTLADAAQDLLDALKDLLGDRHDVQNGQCIRCGRDYRVDIHSGECPSDDCPAYGARVAIAKATGGIS